MVWSHGAVDLEDEGNLLAANVCLEVAADDAPPEEALDGARLRRPGGVCGQRPLGRRPPWRA